VSVASVIIVACIVVLGYTWIGYPPMLALCARLFGRRSPTSDRRPSTADLPHIDVILSAYNEAPVIRDRLSNLVSLDYPSDRLAIHVGTDGCTDNTASIVREFNAGPVSLHLHEFPDNRGKPAVLKDLVEAATQAGAGGFPPASNSMAPASFFVFTDANTYYAPDALQQLVQPFSDPEVGGVCGRVILHGRNRAAQSEGVDPAPEASYWGFETRLKMWESSLDSCLGANGPIYAIRPECFWKDLPGNTVVDDLVIAMRVRELGKRVLFEPKAVSTEELPETKDEWCRRVRIGSGDYQAISFCRRSLLPSQGWFAWAFWSHKVLRWFTPHLMFLAAISAAIGSSLALLTGASAFLSHLVSVGTVVALLLWAMARALVFLRPPLALRSPEGEAGTSDYRLPAIAAPLRLLDHFLTMQLALFCGFIRFCSGELKGSWRRTPR